MLFEEFISVSDEEKRKNTLVESAPIATGRIVCLQPGDQKELKRLMPSFSYDRVPSDHINSDSQQDHDLATPAEPLHLSRGGNIEDSAKIPLKTSNAIRMIPLSHSPWRPRANPYSGNSGGDVCSYMNSPTAPDLINLGHQKMLPVFRKPNQFNLQTYGDGWLLKQSAEIIRYPVINRINPCCLVLRDQTQWLLAQVQTNNNRLQLQYLAPARNTED